MVRMPLLSLPGGRRRYCLRHSVARWAACVLLALALAGCRMAHVEVAKQQPDTTEQPVGPAAPEPGTPAPENTPAGQPGGTPALALAAASAAEGDGVLRFTVSLSGATGAAVTVAYETEDGTATAGSDYQAARGRLTFSAESTAAQRIEVRLVDDQVDESGETLTVRLSDPQGATLASAAATGTIRDDDSRALAVDSPELFVTEGGSASYEVTLGSRPTGPVTVTVSAADAPELTIEPERLVFQPARWRQAQEVRLRAAQDEDALAEAAVEVSHTASGGGYDGVAGPAVTVTIVEDDVATLAMAAAQATERAGRIAFAVTLSLASDEAVTVNYETGASGDTATVGQDYARASGTLRFPARSVAARTVALIVTDDNVDEDTEMLTVTLSGAANAQLAGGGQTLTARGWIEDDDALPGLSIGGGSLAERAGGAGMQFEVRLDAASGRRVTVQYWTADVTATGGRDYTAVSGTLTFGAGATVRTVTVAIIDDTLDEPEEQFTVTLHAAVNATVGTATGTGTIADNDDAPELSIGDASRTEGAEDGSMAFAVRLDAASGRTVTVEYVATDGTATAGSDYTSASGTLTFLAGTTTAAVVVAILDDSEEEETETFTVTLSGASGATLSDASATGTITDDGDTTTTDPVGPVEPPDSAATTPPELSSLSVTGGGTMYPSFDAGTLHYALRCNGSSTLSVSAATGRAGATLTLLRADSADSVVSDTGSLSASVTVDGDHDVAIELAADGAAVTYVVHCFPSGFPTISVLQKTGQVTDGLILATPRRLRPSLTSYIAVFDNNGVPRFQRSIGASSGHQFSDFRRHPDGRYSVMREVTGATHDFRVDILDSQFNVTSTESVVAPLTHTDGHDFLIVSEGTGAGNHIFLSLDQAERDFTPYGPEFSANHTVSDSVIQEVTEDGNEVFRWNSWDHREVMQLGNDCKVAEPDYAHINSLQLVDGDLVASFFRCRQVLRIDRSGGTGAVQWKLGGSAPPAGSATEYLEVSGDPEGEFCAPHHATLTGSDTVVLFDNGVSCLGARKTRPALTRAVEYDISSGTQARYVRSFAIPSGNGLVVAQGGVTVLGSGADTRWLIAWGGVRRGDTAAAQERIEISEVDPASGTVHLHLNMSSNGWRYDTYRAYRYLETDVSPSLNLP